MIRGAEAEDALWLVCAMKYATILTKKGLCVYVKNNIIIRLLHTKLDENTKKIKMEGNPNFRK